MKPHHPLATELNTTIEKQHPSLFSLLSKKGRAAYFPRLGVLSQASDADGTKINATIGVALDDDGTPTHLHSIGKHVTLDPRDVFLYSTAFGNGELRLLWQQEIRRKNPSLGNAPITMPVVAAGLTHALSIVGFLFLDPGDEIILPTPYWDNYDLMLEDAFESPFVTFPLFATHHGTTGFNVNDLQSLLAAKPGKQVVFLNFPNNPTGYTPLRSEAEEIVSIIRESAERGNRILAIIDDAYFGLTFEDRVEPESLFARMASLHANVLAVKIDGATKEHYAWGLRVGFLTYGTKGMAKETAKALEEKSASVVRASVSNASQLSQSLILQALQNPETEREKQEKFQMLRERYLRAKEELKNPDYAGQFTPLPSNSGYFLCIKLRDGLDAEAVRQKLLKEYSTGVIAIGQMLRVAFSSVPSRNIPSLFRNIFAACKELS